MRGSDKTALVEGVLKQVAHVQEAVGDVPATVEVLARRFRAA